MKEIEDEYEKIKKENGNTKEKIQERFLVVV